MRGADRYRVLRPIKKGGMAEVLEARVVGHEGFERKIALKRLRADLSADPSFVRSFIDEARIASQLHHANIVSVFDFGFLDGVLFQALELVEGVDLLDLYARADDRSVRLPTEVALHIANEVAHALEYAHNATDASGKKMRIVHRDVSPENILVSW